MSFWLSNPLWLSARANKTQNNKMQTLELQKLDNVTLYYREGTSDKVYQCQIEQAGPRFVVNFAYGRRGSTLNTGTKTNVPVDYDHAKRIFDQLVKEKMAKGYKQGQAGTTHQHIEKAVSGLYPQLLNPIDAREVVELIRDSDWCAQEKYDGRRLMVRRQGTEIHGINKRGYLVGLPEPVFHAVHGLEMDVVLDGESVGDHYHAFDLLVLDSVNIRDWPYRERLAALLNLLCSVQQTTIRLAETAFSPDQKVALVAKLKEAGREGVVFKQLYAGSVSGRPSEGGTQLKHKFCATLSAVVAKVNRQRSVELHLIGRDGRTGCGNVTIPANHTIPIPGQVVEVRYLYAFRESGVLFQPVYLGVREDVLDSECLTSQLKYKPDSEG